MAENRFGQELDQNGYAESIVNSERVCFWSGESGTLVRHEIFHGSNRRKSKELGLWVWLTPEVHMALHAGKDQIDKRLKRIGQLMAMSTYNWSTDEFRREFGKNYIG